MSANGISTLPTKEERQLAKLNLAALNRAEDGNPRATYNISQLPTRYVGSQLSIMPTSADDIFKDFSGNNITLTSTGTPTFDSRDPWNSSLGSIQFGGINQHLYIEDSSSFLPGTNDFTVEWWQYQTSLGAGTYPRAWAIGPWPNTALGVSIENGQFLMWVNTSYLTPTISLSNLLNQWVHFAVVRSGSSINVFQQGQIIGNYTDSSDINDISQQLSIGGAGGPYENTTRFPGLITNFKFVIGEVLYTEEFDPLTQTLPNNQLYDNPNPDGLVYGRPWIESP